MICYWKKEIDPKSDRMSWNFHRCYDISGMYVENDVQASSSGITELYGVLLTSTLTMVVDMDGLFIYDERSVGGTTVYFFEDQVISQRQLYVFGSFECFRGV